MTNEKVKILCVGDVVGPAGTEYIRKNLWKIRKELDADMAIVNGENAASSNGLDKDSAEILFASGADVITGGNHTFQKHSFRQYLDGQEYLLRPANYPSGTFGNGYCIFNLCGYRVLVINLLGTLFLESVDSPFLCADKILEREKGNFDISLIDFHAEATSEKVALGRYLDGRVSAVFGTHTHIQTADEQIFTGGTGFICDLGMTGVRESILGIQKEPVIERFLTKLPTRFEDAEGECFLCGALFEIDLKSGMCQSVKRVRFDN